MLFWILLAVLTLLVIAGAAGTFISLQLRVARRDVQVMRLLAEQRMDAMTRATIAAMRQAATSMREEDRW